jgi:TolA-binding protein
MGVSLLMSGKAKEAKEYLKKVIEKYPDSSWSAEAKKELGRISQ